MDTFLNIRLKLIVTDFASGDGKQAVIEIIKKNPTGVYLKDLVNIFLLNPENQLETKKKLNKVTFSNF